MNYPYDILPKAGLTSIIIPTYQHAEFVNVAVGSALL